MSDNEITVSAPGGPVVADIVEVVVGPPGPEGPAGPAGGSTSLLPYTLSASTTAPPGDGNVGLDNATAQSATAIRASLVTADGQSAQTSLYFLDAGDAVSLEWTTAPASIGYSVTGPIVQQTGYIEIPVSWVYGSPPPTGPVYLGLFRVGPQGPPGSGSGGAVTRQYVQVRQAGATQDLPSDTFTKIEWDTEDFDPDAMFDAASPTRLTAPVAGVYRLGGAIAISFDGNGYRAAHWGVNGSIVAQSPAVFVGSNATGAHVMCVSLLVNLNAGDYVEMFVFQNSGVLLTTVTAPNYQSFINMMREV